MRITFAGLLFTILFVNITVSANNWSISGIHIGQFIFWISIAVAIRVVVRTPYASVGLGALAVALWAGLWPMVTGSTELKSVKIIALSIIFILAGTISYRGSSERLYRHLWIFFAISIPIMFAQKAGLSSAVMVWNTEVFHDNDIYTFDENDLGKFTYVAPLMKTLFVKADDVTYVIAQGRPSGLLYSNNVLSVFLVTALSLSLVSKRTRRLRLDQMVLAASIPLVMSLTATAALPLLALVAYLFGTRNEKRNVFRLAAFTIVAFGVHYWLFPGLTEAGLSQVRIIVSVGQRFGELSQLLGITTIADFLEVQGSLLGVRTPDFEESSYSQIAILLKSQFSIALAPVTLWGLYVFARALKRRTITHGDSLIFSLFVLGCILTQIGVPYLAAPSFQFLLGFGLTPMFDRLTLNQENS
jgi:hypothetical protein